MRVTTVVTGALATLYVLAVVAAILAIMASVGCKTWNSVAATTWQESFIIDQCHKAAAWQGKPDIKCRITDDIYTVQWEGQETLCAGWYSSGTAYFWQDWVNKQEVPAVLTELACHETSHSKIKEHSAEFYELVGQCVRGIR